MAFFNGKFTCFSPSVTLVNAGYPFIDSGLITSYLNFCTNGASSDVAPYLDTRSATTCANMFRSCQQLVSFSHTFELGNCTNASAMFSGCVNLTEVHMHGSSSVTSFASAFNGCSSLVTIQGLDMTACTVFSAMFTSCSSLTNVTLDGTIKIGSNQLNLGSSPNLTVASLMEFINAFEDNTGGATYTVTFGATNLAKLTANQQAIATNKNIALA